MENHAMQELDLEEVRAEQSVGDRMQRDVGV